MGLRTRIMGVIGWPSGFVISPKGAEDQLGKSFAGLLVGEVAAEMELPLADSGTMGNAAELPWTNSDADCRSVGMEAVEVLVASSCLFRCSGKSSFGASIGFGSWSQA